MASRGRAARAKGLRFEQEVAVKFREIFPAARRHLENHAQDANGVDLQGTDPFKVQCKKLQNYASINTIKEIQCDREFGDVPILVTAGDGLEPMAVLPFSELLKLLKAGRN